MEVQHPVIAGDHDLAVDQERLRLEAAAASTIAGKRSAQSWLLRVSSGRASHPGANQPIAVMLNFVNPQWAGRRPGHLRRQARFEEAGGASTLRNHGRRIEQRPWFTRASEDSVLTHLARRRSTPSLDCRQKWRMASRRVNIEVAGIATAILSVAVLAVVLFSAW